MNKRTHVKGNLRRSDFLRAVITDTAPYEVPIVISNDGFYRNLANRQSASAPLAELIDKLVLSTDDSYTIPYRYKISKDAKSARQLSLIHPSNQFRASQFYKKYETLITYYCSVSNFSIRRPFKAGSTFFFKSSLADINKYKHNRVDTADLDLFARNPASFFSYDGVDRLYKFFNSPEYGRLEKKYPHMLLMDVSKCFSSIYTHSIAWAVKGTQHSKDNVKAAGFGNDFDRLMQKMNFNETNGICVGPEISRIFAEIILGTVDAKVETRLKVLKLVHGRDYDCRRYVDDYIVFCDSEKNAARIQSVISDCLGEFNLHLNEEKSTDFKRPFVTAKSRIISAVKLQLDEFFSSILEGAPVLGGVTIPKKIYNPQALIPSLVGSIKAVCYDQKASYDMVANYVTSSLIRRVESLVDGFVVSGKGNQNLEEFYAAALKKLIEGAFFFYTVHPTVASSYHIGRGLIVFWRFLRDHLPHEMPSASDVIHGLVGELISKVPENEEFSYREKIPVEFLNVLIAAGEVDDMQSLGEGMLAEYIFHPHREDYFSLVSCLFYIKDKPGFDDLRRRVEQAIIRILSDCKNVTAGAHDAHLALDSICCPYLTKAGRVKILRDLRAALQLPVRGRVALEADIAEMQALPWFVQWESIDILNMVRKKELSPVY